MNRSHAPLKEQRQGPRRVRRPRPTTGWDPLVICVRRRRRDPAPLGAGRDPSLPRHRLAGRKPLGDAGDKARNMLRREARGSGPRAARRRPAATPARPPRPRRKPPPRQSERLQPGVAPRLQRVQPHPVAAPRHRDQAGARLRNHRRFAALAGLERAGSRSKSSRSSRTLSGSKGPEEEPRPQPFCNALSRSTSSARLHSERARFECATAAGNAASASPPARAGSPRDGRRSGAIIVEAEMARRPRGDIAVREQVEDGLAHQPAQRRKIVAQRLEHTPAIAAGIDGEPSLRTWSANRRAICSAIPSPLPARMPSSIQPCSAASASGMGLAPRARPSPCRARRAAPHREECSHPIGAGWRRRRRAPAPARRVPRPAPAWGCRGVETNSCRSRAGWARWTIRSAGSAAI